MVFGWTKDVWKGERETEGNAAHKRGGTGVRGRGLGEGEMEYGAKWVDSGVVILFIFFG